LAALVAFLVVTPFVQDMPDGDLVEAVLLTVVLLTAVLAIGGRRRDLIIALVLVTPAVGGKWLNHFRPAYFPAPVFIAFAIAFGLYVVTVLQRFILQAPRVDTQVLCAALSGFLMLGLLWAMAYLMIERISPNSFANVSPPHGGASLDPFSALYFSFITICTVGYGDIAPVSRVARMLAMMEGLTGMFYVAVLISRLVALYSTQSQTGQGTGEEEKGEQEQDHAQE
jgi:hypothetical protein